MYLQFRDKLVKLETLEVKQTSDGYWDHVTEYSVILNNKFTLYKGHSDRVYEYFRKIAEKINNATENVLRIET